QKSTAHRRTNVELPSLVPITMIVDVVLAEFAVVPRRRRGDAFLTESVDRDDPVSPRAIRPRLFVDPVRRSERFVEAAKRLLPRAVDPWIVHAVDAVTGDALLRVRLPANAAL